VAKKRTGFESEAQRRAVMALLTQRLVGLKPSFAEKTATAIPGTAKNRLRRTIRKRPATAGRLFRQGRADLRSALITDLRKREGRKARAKRRIKRDLMNDPRTQQEMQLALINSLRTVKAV
jgi:hypothetical protein